MPPDTLHVFDRPTGAAALCFTSDPANLAWLEREFKRPLFVRREWQLRIAAVKRACTPKRPSPATSEATSAEASLPFDQWIGLHRAGFNLKTE